MIVVENFVASLNALLICLWENIIEIPFPHHLSDGFITKGYCKFCSICFLFIFSLVEKTSVFGHEIP
jgi:hypothetical protein